MSPADWQAGLAEFFHQGGTLLWVILALSTLMWALIAERYWFWLRESGPSRRTLARAWSERRPDAERHDVAMRVLDQLVAEFRGRCDARMELLRTLTAALPLVGLLGTVSGMIKVFEVITVFGTGNTRGMAAGIAEALLTTMAGLLTALSGLYFVSHLEGRAERETSAVRAELIDILESS